jgi:hypothetical protein
MLLTIKGRWADDGLLGWNQMNNSTLAAGKQSHVYILRLWHAEAPDSSWRASLENPRTGERIGFESLERLFAFLMERTERDTNIKQGGKDGDLLTG